MTTDLFVTIGVAFLVTQVAIITTTVFLHRVQTHRAANLHPVLAGVFRFLTWITTGIRPRQWVAVHRKHHAHTDTADDPHSPAQLGWFRVQLTNVFLYRDAARDAEVVRKYAKDLPPDRFDRWFFDRGLLGLGVGTLAVMAWIGPVRGLVAMGIHVVLYLGLSGAVNAVGHHFGERPFDNSATNLRWLTLLTGGEGLHNNHHAAPTSARFARRWSDLDFGWWVIRSAERVHLAVVRHRDVDALARRPLQSA